MSHYLRRQLETSELPGEFSEKSHSSQVRLVVNVLLEKKCEEEVILVMLDYGYSESFANLMRMAHKHNCWWINIDCDGEYVAGLEINDW